MASEYIETKVIDVIRKMKRRNKIMLVLGEKELTGISYLTIDSSGSRIWDRQPVKPTERGRYKMPDGTGNSFSNNVTRIDGIASCIMLGGVADILNIDINGLYKVTIEKID